MHRLSLIIGLTILTSLTAGTWAQQPPPAQPAPAQPKIDPANPMAMWNIQQMIDRAVSQVVKRYSLTPEQEEFTRNLMAARVNSFLDKHEQEIRDIFAEAIKFQIAGTPPSPEKVKEWTATITPMFDEAKVSIIDGNHEFREILSDDQRKVHDVDLKIMENNFKDAEQRLGRWREGEFDPTRDFADPNRPQQRADRTAGTRPRTNPAAPVPANGQASVTPQASAPVPPGPAAPAAPSRVSGPSAGSADRTADFWEMYVQKFIANYQLDQNQSNLAMQILAESRKRASEYLTSRKDEYERLQTLLANAGNDPKAAAEIQKQITDLNKPVQEDLFNEMKQRLDRIPTETQRKIFEATQAKKVAASGPASRPAAAASRPASSRPVASRPALRRSTATQPAAISRTATSQPAAHK